MINWHKPNICKVFALAFFFSILLVFSDWNIQNFSITIPSAINNSLSFKLVT